MRNKKLINFNKLKSKLIIPLIITASVILLSVIAVTANTVPYTVIDGDNKYEVSIIFPEEKTLIEKAENVGMNKFNELDDAFLNEEACTLTVYRAVDLTLSIEGEKKTIHANVGQTIESALNEANVNSDNSLKVLPSPETVITSDMEVRLNSGYIVNINGTEHEIDGNTVADALKEAKVKYDGNDDITPDLNSKLIPGMDISYVEGYKITVANGSFKAETSTFATTVEEFLNERKITLDDNDRLSPSKSAKITDGTEIIITRVYSVNETVTETVDYGTDYEPSVHMIWGGTKLKTPGEKGSDKVTYFCTYENGVLVSKEEVARETIKEPVNEILLKRVTSNYQKEVEAAVINNEGTGDNYFIDHNGNKVYYKKILTGEATAYCIPNGITSVGLPVGVGIVAVDPKVIPYGSLLYIETANHLYGYGIAGDTGGAMLSGRVLTDLYMDTIEDCSLVGRCRVKVYIIE